MKVTTVTLSLVAAGTLVAGADTHVNPPADLTVTSGLFQNQGTLPTEMSCDGADTPPMLTWSGAPAGTKSFAIEVRDLDNHDGRFSHWIVSGIPANLNAIGGVPPGAVAGMNSDGDNGWDGPCPPAGETHRYQFTVMAIDKDIHSRDFTLDKLDSAMNGHVLASGAIVAAYTRPAGATNHSTDLKAPDSTNRIMNDPSTSPR
jgi:Raf kinase inhibitor-like YbhB/YbcL family protein